MKAAVCYIVLLLLSDWDSEANVCAARSTSWQRCCRYSWWSDAANTNTFWQNTAAPQLCRRHHQFTHARNIVIEAAATNAEFTGEVLVCEAGEAWEYYKN